MNYSANSENLPEGKEAGMALMLTMFALALLSVLGMIMIMDATMEIRISDNHVSHAQATLAAISGLNHARAVVHGLDFDALLRGPNGVYRSDTSYITEAKSFGFRLPFSVLTAQKLNVESPLDGMENAYDDGIINAGAHGATLIPREGIAQWADNPNGSGPMILSRYFVKVTDNNGEASEVAADAANNPFVDSDGIIIVRSIGVSRTFSETTGSNIRRNSVAVFESRLRRTSTWDLGPALNILGNSVNAVFTGSPEIAGETTAGIGVLNTAPDGTGFTEQLRLQTAAVGNITGGGLATPSIRDISAETRNNRDKSALFNAAWVKDFIERRAPRMADTVYEGNRLWMGTNLPFLGIYDKTRPWNDSVQKPHVALINGNLTAPEGLRGAGVLIITGRLECGGTLDYHGLILVLGAGELSLVTDGPGITGGIITGKLINSGGETTFGSPNINIGGFTQITADKDLVRMALRLFPIEQISFREIAGSDP